jgi:hypothetical protein
VSDFCQLCFSQVIMFGLQFHSHNKIVGKQFSIMVCETKNGLIFHVFGKMKTLKRDSCQLCFSQVIMFGLQFHSHNKIVGKQFSIMVCETKIGLIFHVFGKMKTLKRDSCQLCFSQVIMFDLQFHSHNKIVGKQFSIMVCETKNGLIFHVF